jgi:hypothetical protein
VAKKASIDSLLPFLTYKQEKKNENQSTFGHESSYFVANKRIVNMAHCYLRPFLAMIGLTDLLKLKKKLSFRTFSSIQREKLTICYQSRILKPVNFFKRIK